MSWCDHTFTKSKVPDYEVCGNCGTYRSTAFVKPSELYAGQFWGTGHSSIWEQVWNVDMHAERGIPKNRFVLDRIGCDRRGALDIGCAPGRMLYWLKWAARFAHVAGIEAVGDNHDDIRKIGCHDGPLYAGLFPDMEAGGPYSFVSALDVFEHSDKPDAFLAGCHRLLEPRGQLFLMLPLAEDLAHDSRFFSPAEHVYIHTRRHLHGLMVQAGFVDVRFDRWAVGHDTVSGRRR